MKVMVGIPTLDNVHWEFFLHTTPIIAKLRLKHEVILCCVNRCSIDRARQMTVESAFSGDIDRLLFIDDDTLIPTSTFNKLNSLLDNEKILSASGVSYQRGYPYWPMAYKYEDFDWASEKTHNQSHQIIAMPDKPFRVSCNGMGVSLLDVNKMRDIENPCFSRLGPGTEDFYFYSKVWKAGYEAWIDPSVQAVHLGDRVKVDKFNVDELRGVSIRKMHDESSGRSVLMEAVL